ncbi:hypothetical protein GGR52DRAFT_327301 [Hypoxylon sp. FL1284]|nr:hypothetical protein GGR52DRAFT_327301 [Hypoxylon sp. FL1284]
MAAKTSLPTAEENRPSRCRSGRRNRLLLNLTFVALVIYALCRITSLSSYAVLFVPENFNPQSPQVAIDTPVPEVQDLVPFEAHIMSKCPDARDCLRDMVLPAMVRVYDKVNFTLSFIGTPTENDGVDCKHGPGECMGNILELCARHLYPDPKIYLGFTMCLTKDYKSIPERELVEDCALEHAIDFEKLNECAARDSGAFGVAMLRESVRRTAEVRLKWPCQTILQNYY